MRKQSIVIDWRDNDREILAPPDEDRWGTALAPLGGGTRVVLLAHEDGRRWHVHQADRTRADVGGGPFRPPEDVKAEAVRLLKAAGLPVVDD
jgi:hypothetical protein